YVVLQRRGVPRWLAALATAPILLDGYQLQIEQTIMPDVMFEACIVAGLAALLWQPRPRTALVIAGGLALGASATARQVGEILILPALAYLLVAGPGWLDHQLGSPIKSFQAPLGMSSSAVTSDFNHRVLFQQPGRVLTAIGKDALKLYAVKRVGFPGDTSISRWQFQTSYPQYPPY